MKLLTLFFSFFLLIGSCSDSDVENGDGEQVPLQGSDQKWELVRMTGSFANSETVGEDMDWQEYYILKSDGTFSKQRDRNGATIEASGSYEFISKENEAYFELTYKTGKELIASCSGDGKEFLMLDGDVLYGTWNACDGPGLEYHLVK